MLASVNEMTCSSSEVLFWKSKKHYRRCLTFFAVSSCWPPWLNCSNDSPHLVQHCTCIWCASFLLVEGVMMCCADSSTVLHEQWDAGKKNDMLGAQVRDLKRCVLRFRTRCPAEERANIWTIFYYMTASFEPCSESSILRNILPIITSVRETSPTNRTQGCLYYSSPSCYRVHLAHIRGTSSIGLWPLQMKNVYEWLETPRLMRICWFYLGDVPDITARDHWRRAFGCKKLIVDCTRISGKEAENTRSKQLGLPQSRLPVYSTRQT